MCWESIRVSLRVKMVYESWEKEYCSFAHRLRSAHPLAREAKMRFRFGWRRGFPSSFTWSSCFLFLAVLVCLVCYCLFLPIPSSSWLYLPILGCSYLFFLFLLFRGHYYWAAAQKRTMTYVIFFILFCLLVLPSYSTPHPKDPISSLFISVPNCSHVFFPVLVSTPCSTSLIFHLHLLFLSLVHFSYSSLVVYVQPLSGSSYTGCVHYF